MTTSDLLNASQVRDLVSGPWPPTASLLSVLLRDGSAWHAAAHACVCAPATGAPPLHPPVAVTRPDGDAVRGCAAIACVESIRGRIPLSVSGAWVRDQHARAEAQEMSLPNENHYDSVEDVAAQLRCNPHQNHETCPGAGRTAVHSLLAATSRASFSSAASSGSNSAPSTRERGNDLRTLTPSSTKFSAWRIRLPRPSDSLPRAAS